MFGVGIVITSFINEQVKIESQKDSQDQAGTGNGKNKKGNKSENNLKEEMMKHKIGMFLTGNFVKLNDGFIITVFDGSSGQEAVGVFGINK